MIVGQDLVFMKPVCWRSSTTSCVHIGTTLSKVWAENVEFSLVWCEFELSVVFLSGWRSIHQTGPTRRVPKRPWWWTVWGRQTRTSRERGCWCERSMITRVRRRTSSPLKQVTLFISNILSHSYYGSKCSKFIFTSVCRRSFTHLATDFFFKLFKKIKPLFYKVNSGVNYVWGLILKKSS